MRMDPYVVCRTSLLVELTTDTRGCMQPNIDGNIGISMVEEILTVTIGWW